MISIKMIFIVTSGKFDGGFFSSDDGDWEHSETWEIDEKEFEDETLNKCDWEDRYE